MTSTDSRVPYRFEDSVKDLDVEEAVDYYLHRRLSFWLVIKPIELLDVRWITPMKLTLASIALGIASGVVSGLVPELGPSMAIYGALLLVLHVVLDCADGMLARLRGGGSNLGMLVDGLGDGVVGVAYWAGIARSVAHGLEGWWVWPTLVFILVSIAVHTSLYDNLKNKFVAMTTPPRPADAPAPAPSPSREMSPFERRAEEIIERIYKVYGGAGVAIANASVHRTDPALARRLLRPSMRTTSAIGLGTSLFVMYVAGFLYPVWPLAPLVIGLAFPAGIGNVLMVVALLQWRSGERAIERAAPGS